MILTPLASLSWQFRDAASTTWLPATVPGCVHTDLLASNLIPDPFFASNEHDLQWIGEHDWEYRCQFSVSKQSLLAEVTDLVADGLDTVATITLNGHTVARTENMFVAHHWNVTRHLKSGRNELLVRFHSATQYVRQTRTNFSPPREYCDPVGNSVRIRKQPCQFGWDWGPRLVTAGIWRDLRLESWSTNRLHHVRFHQTHRSDGTVSLDVIPDFTRRRTKPLVTVVVSFEGKEVTRMSSSAAMLTLEIPAPQLWWPAGQGNQPLYDVEISAFDDNGVSVGKLSRRLGLRTILLDRHPDQWGESFQFLVNGRAIFAKGANWIPAHSFVTTLKRADYARDLTAAVAANMNCIRVWGGGIYESENFYDLCDELGLLVWQDFMFACALFPSDRKFVETVEAEAICQVRRLHHHACLALWCGNNEVAQLNAAYLQASPKFLRGYEAIFHRLLPKVVSTHDGSTRYWPSSEWRGTINSGHSLGEKSGDSHYWDVWHARHPVKDYERWAFRFCSEFGMQSYSSPATNATFTRAEDHNVFGPAMENHQKNRSGNQVILDYVSRRYRFPKTQQDLIYLSQLNQAYCMQVGVEHYRRLMPRCMGTLYWQLNDCWPVTSWSSIEFTGRWKALHHAARRFYAPVLACAHVPGDETTQLGNIRASTVDQVHLYTVSDAPQPAHGFLHWRLVRLDGNVVLTGRKRVTLRHGESIQHKTLSLLRHFEKHGREQLYLRIAVDIDGDTVSQQSVFFASPRFMHLPRGKIRTTVRMTSQMTATITFRSRVFQHAVAFDLPGLPHRASDNFFDLYPDESRRIEVRFEIPATRQRVVDSLRQTSLADTYD